MGASKACADLERTTKEALRTQGLAISLKVRVEGAEFALQAEGDPRLTLSSEKDMVIRKSRFVSERTLAVAADHAARDIPRSLVKLLKDPGAAGVLEVGVIG